MSPRTRNPGAPFPQHNLASKRTGKPDSRCHASLHCKHEPRQACFELESDDRLQLCRHVQEQAGCSSAKDRRAVVIVTPASTFHARAQTLRSNLEDLEAGYWEGPCEALSQKEHQCSASRAGQSGHISRPALRFPMHCESGFHTARKAQVRAT